ncbi:unnamed protein product [Caenorhabditis angaria]|uniref:Uncharacterized protein n=1 Tax=Caenorhabditis angaria TaxID=860376 RepID=A0A9P1J563_9PELO|nr:unnamed protein product [Caenorhabditis angaria]
MRFFLLRCQANGFGNALPWQRDNFNLGIAFLIVMDCENETQFNRFCEQYRFIMQSIQRINPHLRIPQLTRWNEFDFNTLPTSVSVRLFSPDFGHFLRLFLDCLVMPPKKSAAAAPSSTGAKRGRPRRSNSTPAPQHPPPQPQQQGPGTRRSRSNVSRRSPSPPSNIRVTRSQTQQSRDAIAADRQRRGLPRNSVGPRFCPPTPPKVTKNIVGKIVGLVKKKKSVEKKAVMKKPAPKNRKPVGRPRGTTRPAPQQQTSSESSSGTSRNSGSSTTGTTATTGSSATDDEDADESYRHDSPNRRSTSRNTESRTSSRTSSRNSPSTDDDDDSNYSHEDRRPTSRQPNRAGENSFRSRSAAPSTTSRVPSVPTPRPRPRSLHRNRSTTSNADYERPPVLMVSNPRQDEVDCELSERFRRFGQMRVDRTQSSSRRQPRRREAPTQSDSTSDSSWRPNKPTKTNRRRKRRN